MSAKCGKVTLQRKGHPEKEDSIPYSGCRGYLSYIVQLGVFNGKPPESLRRKDSLTASQLPDRATGPLSIVLNVIGTSTWYDGNRMKKDEADAWIQRRAQGMEVIGELTSHRPDQFTAIGELAELAR